MKDSKSIVYLEECTYLSGHDWVFSFHIQQFSIIPGLVNSGRIICKSQKRKGNPRRAQERMKFGVENEKKAE